MHDFITSCSGHLENTDSVSYEYLPNDTFHFAVFKNHICQYHHWSYQKSLYVSGSCQPTACIQVFQNANFCLKTGLLSLAAITVNCLPWNGRLILFMFEKISANSQLQITIVCLWVIKMMFCEKKCLG